METLYFLLPVALILALVGLLGMIWALKSGQFDDMEGPAHRILYDDDDHLIPGRETPPAAPPETPPPPPSR
ncbi:MAG: cbb3-type cytochrome oxidase assembly protein CcoS [Magnetococcus sp. WYHC-3]